MSRIGKTPINLPKNVEITITDSEIHVKGSKGILKQNLIPGVVIKVENNQVLVSTATDNSSLSNFHGLYRALVSNMIKGVTDGFEKKLEMIGVGYRAAVQGEMLDLQVGYSHDTKLPIPKGISVKVEKNTLITISGFDKHLIGQFAADIRRQRPPEVYQGKGIRYVGEYVRKKAGKSTAKK